MKRILFLIIILFLFSGIALGYELGAGDGTGYPGEIDTDASVEVDYPDPLATTARAAVPNDTNAAVIAIETELGINPSGAYDTLKARLDAGDGLYYLKTEIDSQAEIETIWEVLLVNDGDLDLYYLKTAIDTQGEMETIWGVTLATDAELAALKFTDLTDTPANYTGQAGKYVKVNAGETDLEFGTPAGGGTYLELTDTPAAYDNGKYAKSTADGVVWDDPAGAGDMTKAVYDIDTDNIVDKAETVDDGVGNSSTAADVKDAVTKKHTQNTDTQLDLYSALFSDHTWTGEKDLQPIGESVVFGDLLYFDWTDKEWKKADADASATMPGLRIALENKSDGQACLMLVKGYIRVDAWNFTGAMVYVSEITAGAMTSTAPSTAGNQLQRVGQAKSVDILFFDPSIDVGEI